MTLPSAPPIGSLDAYLGWVNQVPMLTADQEYDHAQRLQQENDLNAAQALILPHLRFVVRIAKNYNGYGLALGDLIQEGNIGLMKAVKRFQPEMGVRLVSFAVHWIKAEIHEFIIRNWRIVKVATTKAQRKLFFKLRSAKKRLGWFTHQEIQDVAQDLGVSCKDVVAMEQRLNAQDAVLDPTANDDDEFTPGGQIIRYLEAPESSDPALALETLEMGSNQEKKLRNSLATLDPRSQDILYHRWLADEKATLHDLADKYQVSAERIRQLEANAMKKIRFALSV